MQQKTVFMNWLINNNKLSASTASKYAGAIKTISVELRGRGLLEGDTYSVNDPNTIDSIFIRYFSIPEYYAKNQRGNKMYSNALRHFRGFVESRNK